MNSDGSMAYVCLMATPIQKRIICAHSLCSRCEFFPFLSCVCGCAASTPSCCFNCFRNRSFNRRFFAHRHCSSGHARSEMLLVFAFLCIPFATEWDDNCFWIHLLEGIKLALTMDNLIRINGAFFAVATHKTRHGNHSFEGLRKFINRWNYDGSTRFLLTFQDHGASAKKWNFFCIQLLRTFTGGARLQLLPVCRFRVNFCQKLGANFNFSVWLQWFDFFVRLHSGNNRNDWCESTDCCIQNPTQNCKLAL